ncbi:hypothetical protein ACYEXS_26255 [Paenibacillus sp. MAH-36]|uniref:hypothetical protein n=1 Tax=Paenibacillus sp. GCM10012304 TaxID=3317341 RepID=UPI0036073AB5
MQSYLASNIVNGRHQDVIAVNYISIYKQIYDTDNMIPLCRYCSLSISVKFPKYAI